MTVDRPPAARVPVRTLLGLAVLAGGVVSFCGWAFDLRRLTDWFDDGISTQPNTALLLAFAGAALALMRERMRWPVGLLGAFVMLAGAATLSQYFAGADFGFNDLFLFGRPWGHATTLSPGRMGPPASTAFTLIGLGMLLFALRPAGSRARRLVPVCGVAVALIAALSLIGHLFDARPFYSLPWLTAIALQTALMLALLSIGLVCAAPEHQPLRLLLSDTGAGALARRFLPVLVFLPPLLGWLRTEAQRLDLFDAGTGRAFLILSLMILGAGLLWWALLALARTEAATREAARARLREQKLVTEQLKLADRRKNEFLAILAHELRGPLAPLRNALEMQKRAGDGVLAERARAIMDRQLAHLARLVDDLLDVSRITRDRIEIRREPVELGALLAACVESIRPMAAARGQHLALSVPPVPVTLHADPVRLTQAFGNILNNACKYTPPGGHIACAAGVQGGEVVVRIRDDGIGIPREKLRHVFEMFTQLEDHPDGVQAGLGIGLTLAHRFVTLHDGSIAVDSAGRGKGSEFTVRLPVLAVQHPPAPAAPPPVLPCALRFLVVDDNRDSASSLAMLLRLAGHEALVAHDGLAAMEAAARARPQVVLLDIGLPGVSGHEACRRMRTEPWGRDAVIVALTGLGQEADRDRARESGFDHHFVKPVDFDALMSEVARLAAQKPAA